MTKVCHPLDNTSQLALKVIDHVSAMIAYWDKDLICRFATDSYLEWFGKTDAELIDKITLPELLGPLYEKNLPFFNRSAEGKPTNFRARKIA
jgi:PAS domain-containing protein